VERRATRRIRGSTAIAVAAAAVFWAVGAPIGADPGVTELSGPATATVTATRGEQVSLEPSPRAPCRRVAVIGDSLMDNARWYLQGGLARIGVAHVIDAQPSRRIPATVRVPYSGVSAALTVRATHGEFDCWVIALGSNDLIFGGNDPVIAASLIDSMLSSVTPESRVWWVNLNYHRDPRVSFDFVGATTVFNDRLDARAATDPELTIIDWYSLSERNPGWFFDPVHVDATGSRARAEQVVAALPN
jgi:hypothetical protein